MTVVDMTVVSQNVVEQQPAPAPQPAAEVAASVVRKAAVSGVLASGPLAVGANPARGSSAQSLTGGRAGPVRRMDRVTGTGPTVVRGRGGEVR